MHALDTSPTRRRHDLDALRAFAMLLGIGLHGALSFVPFPWPIQDAHQNEHFGWLLAAIHGFRMPVFFVMSGFFTAMLWRRRGLRALLGHRARRIALPLLLGVVTIVPAVDWVSGRGLELGPGQTGEPAMKTVPGTGADQAVTAEQAETVPMKTVPGTDSMDSAMKTVPGTESAGTDRAADVAVDTATLDPATGLTPLSMAAVHGSLDDVHRLLDAGAAVDQRNRDGSTALHVAALFGHADIVERLLGAGAPVNARHTDGSTPLHNAAFFGRVDAAERLIAAGADPSIVNGYGQTPLQVTTVDWRTTQYIGRMVGLELDEADVSAGRETIAVLLSTAATDPAGSPAAETDLSGLATRLMHEPFFHHLWFLWFLCWLVAAFAVYAGLADRFGWRGLPRALTVSPLRLLWLVPITAVPQAFMGRLMPGFGADTSAGLVPMPHVLAFYAVFFAYGALYHDADDTESRVGRWWLASLPLGLFVLLPLGVVLAFAGGVDPGVRLLAVLLQACYPWVMTFGLMGLFRRLLQSERPAVRYLSDASYWLYLAHLPVIMAAQIVVRDWDLPASAKWMLVCAGVTALLLLVYQLAVRYTWLGRLLNGPRARPSRRGTTPLQPSPSLD